MVYSETFTLTSNLSQITFKNKLSKATKLKINQFVYTTASLNNYIMLIILSNWTGQNSYQNTFYTKNIVMPRTTQTSCDYESLAGVWDVELTQPTIIGTHILQLYINNNPSNDDITSENPVYIEIQYE